MMDDLRYAVRLSVNAPALTSVAVLTLALCIGVNSTLFSAVNTVLLRPLPFQHPGELYVVSSTFQGTRREFTSFTDFSDWRAHSRSFAQMAAVRGNGASITTPTGPEYLTGAAVSEDFFAVFATPPSSGRPFVSADHRRGEGHVVILSDALWRRRFGTNPAVIGTSIVLDGESNTIVGVMPKGFAFPDDVEFWTPLTLTASDAARRTDLVRVVGRLRSGVAPTQANEELAAIARNLAERFPSTNAGWGVTLTPLDAKSTEDIRRTLLVLWGAVTCVLLIGCANIGMLVLSRSIRRTHEFAVRTALGAGRWRITRQLAIEGLLLGVGGGAVGLLAASWGIAVLRAFAPAHVRLREVGLDLPVLLYTVALSIGTGILISLVPLWRVARANGYWQLKEGATSPSGRRRQPGVMHTAVTGQVLVSVVLIVFAGLMVKTLTQLNTVPLGFKADHLLTFYVSLPELQYRDGSQVGAFFDQLFARLRSLPDVRSASAINALYINWSQAIVLKVLIEGRPPPTGSQPADTHVRIVDPNIHRVLQIPVLRGRSFDAHDASDGRQVAVINESMAMQYFAGEDPLGRRISVESAGPNTPKWRTVVGVIGNVRQQGLDAEVYPEIQLPYQQSTIPTMAVLVRTIGDPVTLTPVIRAQVQALDPNLPMMLVQTMDDVLDASMARRRFGMRLLTMFASIALSLTAIGLYGVIAACVSGRAREIAVRLAIGASSRQVRHDVVGALMQMVAAGIGAGLLLAVIASRSIEPLLFAVPRTDIGTYATTAAILVATALGSSYLAARRIMGIDPATVLRAE